MACYRGIKAERRIFRKGSRQGGLKKNPPKKDFWKEIILHLSPIHGPFMWTKGGLYVGR